MACTSDLPLISSHANQVDLSKRPFTVWTSEKEVTAQTIIVATGAVARRLEFPGSDEEKGYWNKGISACAVCDGAAPIFRKKPIAVIGGGDTAMVGTRPPALACGNYRFWEEFSIDHAISFICRRRPTS